MSRDVRKGLVELAVLLALGAPAVLLVAGGFRMCAAAHSFALPGAGVVAAGFVLLIGASWYYYRTDLKGRGWKAVVFTVLSCAFSLLASQLFLRIFFKR